MKMISPNKGRDAEDPGEIAEEITDSGITIIVIGIGSGIDSHELDHMAGGPGKAYTAKSFDELIGGEFITKLTSTTCQAGGYIFRWLYFFRWWFFWRW